MAVFLKIDFPDYIVDEESTSTPLDFIWDVYRVMLSGKGPKRHVVAAARNTAKTLSACVLRWYGLIHFRRDGTHLAANLEQSNSATKYLDRFLRLPELAPFVTVNNTRDKTLEGLPPNSYTARDHSTLRIAVATIGGVNSQRGSLNIRDELDLLSQAILSEASFQADPTQDEHMYDPIEINLSSRKTNSGPIQELLDEAEKKKGGDLVAHKWSMVDWMKPCPSEVHQPEKGNVEAWVNIETLKTTWDRRNYEALPEAEKPLQREVSAYEGCRGCGAFLVCQGRSPKQASDSRMLRSIDFVAHVISTVKTADKITAQALNWKPESSAVVFRQFNRTRHYLEPAVAWKWLFREVWNPNNLPVEEVRRIWSAGQSWEKAKLTPTKKDIYKALVAHGWYIYYGIDWGFYPDPSVCSVIAYHRKTRRAFVLHTESANNYSNQDWAWYVLENIWPEYPGDLICPDTEDKSSPTYFAKDRKGMPTGIPCLDSKPPRVETGVSQIRGLLWSPADQVELFAVLDDGPMGQNELFAQSFEKWTHAKTPLGYDFTKFDTKGDWKHWPDTTRYALHPFLEDTQARFRAQQPKTETEQIKAASEGDTEAQKALTHREQETNSTLEQQLRAEHGLGNIHEAKRRLQLEAIEKMKNKAGIKKPEEEPSAKRSHLKFKF